MRLTKQIESVKENKRINNELNEENKNLKLKNQELNKNLLENQETIGQLQSEVDSLHEELENAKMRIESINLDKNNVVNELNQELLKMEIKVMG